MSAPSPRPRRDPRTERAARRIEGAVRPRFALGAVEAAVTAPTVPEPRPPAIRVVEDPAFLVLVIGEGDGAGLSAIDRQLLGAARRLADPGGGAVAFLGPVEATSAGAAGADRLIEVSSADDAEAASALVLAAIEALCPRHVVFAETQASGDLARRVAAALDEPLFAALEHLDGTRGIRRIRAGSAERAASLPRLITIEPDRLAPHRGPRHEARPISPPPAPAAMARALSIPEPVPVDRANQPLADAVFVAAIGQGVSDLDGFRRLAQRLGATQGASRVLCDQGLMPRDRQVGASGTVLAARCYLALGISGAPQHLQGIADVAHVIAVNTDLHAAMIKRAELSVIADAQAVIPALLRLLDADKRS